MFTQQRQSEDAEVRPARQRATQHPVSGIGSLGLSAMASPWQLPSCSHIRVYMGICDMPTDLKLIPRVTVPEI